MTKGLKHTFTWHHWH